MRTGANYFCCTLGEAALLQKGSPPFQTVNHLIERQGSRCPHHPAVGFFRPGPALLKPWDYTVLTFADVLRGSQVVAELLFNTVTSRIPVKQPLALLSSSSADFLFIWLGLIRLGHPVLLLAPQLGPASIAQLCTTCGVHHLFYDEMYGEQARSSARVNVRGPRHSRLVTHEFPYRATSDIFTAIKLLPSQGIHLPSISGSSEAYLHHTSGTSSGKPKPIPQSHHAAVGVLPMLDGQKQATFTTTPLYHGGPADLFRAWTSGAPVWLFPSRELPVTASNIIRCLDIARDAASQREIAPVKYFSCVPYVLQMMAADERALKYLKSMELVGVGGAALPDEIGDFLVSSGVNLVSRYGSAECGYLMSSHRHFSRDSAWQYLRRGPGGSALKFVERDDGLSELVIQPDWPHVVSLYALSRALLCSYVPVPKQPRRRPIRDSGLVRPTPRNRGCVEISLSCGFSAHIDHGQEVRSSAT